MIYTREELEALAKVIVEKDIYCVADEMYENLIYEGHEAVSIASLNAFCWQPIPCAPLPLRWQHQQLF